MKNLIKYLVISLVIFSSCSKENDPFQLPEEDEISYSKIKDDTIKFEVDNNVITLTQNFNDYNKVITIKATADAPVRDTSIIKVSFTKNYFVAENGQKYLTKTEYYDRYIYIDKEKTKSDIFNTPQVVYSRYAMYFVDDFTYEIVK